MAIELQVDTNIDEVRAFVRHVYRDQLPFAISRAINWTALDFQEKQREHMEDIFTIRRPRFVLRAVKIKPFARKQRLSARVSIDPPGGQERADILTKFETERFKVPHSSSRLAVPTEHVARTPTGVIRKRHRLSEFDFEEHGGRTLAGARGRLRSNVAVGKRRTLSIQRPGGRGVVLQRQGRGSGGELVPLYYFVPRVPIDPELDFVDNARRVVRQEWEPNFARSFRGAVQTARPTRSDRAVSRFARGTAFSLGLRPGRLRGGFSIRGR